MKDKLNVLDGKSYERRVQLNSPNFELSRFQQKSVKLFSKKLVNSIDFCKRLVGEFVLNI